MKLAIKFIFFIIFSIFLVSGKKLKNKRANSNLNALEMMRHNPENFNPMKITKYYKNQKPPEDFTINFVDPLFPPNSYSIEGKNRKGIVINSKVPSKRRDKLMGRNPKGKIPKWKRAGDIFKGKPFHVFKDSIEPDDVIQQKIGNCYFLSAVAAITEFPHLIYQLFRTTKTNIHGYYELVLFIDGEWQVVILDDYFVVDNGTSKPKFAKPNGEEIWVMLLEKAWAKINQGFANIVSGIDRDSYYSLTGFVSETFTHEKIKLEDLWNIISNADKNNEIISAASKPGKEIEEKAKNGIIKGHAYTLVGVRIVTLENEEIRLVQLRNPWGRHEWKGDWSDNSPLWTDELKKEVNFKNAKDDGIFFMSVEDFVKNYSSTHICRIKYGSIVKSYKINTIKMNNPIVFNLILEEDSFIVVDVFVKHRRFNRGNNNNPNKITSIILGSYDETGDLNYITSDCKSEEYVDISIKLNKGNYILWVYNSYYMLNDNKPDHYIIRIISESKAINFQKIGNDLDGQIIRKLMNNAIGDDSDVSPLKNGVYVKKGNNYPGTCIGYSRFSLPENVRSSVIIKFYTNKLKNMIFLPPYDNNPPNKVSFNLLPGSSYIVLAIKNDSNHVFKLSSSIGGSSKANISKVDFTEDIDISKYISLSPDTNSFSYDYITTEMSEALKLKHFKVKK